MNIQDKFKKDFVAILEADLKEDISDKEAMAQTLDKGSTPEDFDANTSDVQMDDQDQALQASQDLMNVVNNQNQIMVNKLKDWIVRVQDFVLFLNDTEGESIQNNLTKALPDTLFDKIKTAESKKIARTAVDLASLAETLKGYIVQSNNPKNRFV